MNARAGSTAIDNRGNQGLVDSAQERCLQAPRSYLARPRIRKAPRAIFSRGARQVATRSTFQSSNSALVVLRELAEQHVGDDEAEHGVPEELHRLVVEDAAAGVLVHPRAVRQRVLEQPAILEAIADAPFERLELRAERDDPARAVLVAVAVDDPLGVRGVPSARDPDSLPSAKRLARMSEGSSSRSRGSRAAANDVRLDRAGGEMRSCRDRVTPPRGRAATPNRP